MHDRIFELFFLAEKNINATMFLDMSGLFLFPQVDALPNAGDISLQLDGQLAKAALGEKFPNEWTRKSRPTPWTPRSPDLTVIDFFFWGYIKNIV
jgi:hypothetical protein